MHVFGIENMTLSLVYFKLNCLHGHSTKRSYTSVEIDDNGEQHLPSFKPTPTEWFLPRFLSTVMSGTKAF